MYPLVVLMIRDENQVFGIYWINVQKAFNVARCFPTEQFIHESADFTLNGAAELAGAVAGVVDCSKSFLDNFIGETVNENLMALLIAGQK